VNTVSDATEEQLRPELLAEVPVTLKRRILMDWEQVVENERIISVPRPGKKTISVVFAEYMKEDADEDTKEVCEVLIDLFNRCLPVILLYDVERTAYEDWAKDAPSRRTKAKTPAEVYGCEHLLRLFVKLPTLMVYSRMHEETVKVMRDKLAQLYAWLESKVDNLEYFMQQYDVDVSSSGK
jgi:mortality factor 4-like protein 1